MKANILITDDDTSFAFLLKEELEGEGYSIDVVNDGKYAMESLRRKYYDVLLLDLRMIDVQGEEVLEYVQQNYPSTVVLVLTSVDETRTAIDCIKSGAFDYITKPYEFDELSVIVDRAVKHRKLLLENIVLHTKLDTEVKHSIIGESEAITEAIEIARKAALTNSNLLIRGETGTGKRIFAEFIHNNSIRRDKPFFTINCSTISENLIESELFGHEKGAFTDAVSAKQGLVELADGGTIFLREISELSLNVQPKLLRFIENGEFRRVGGTYNLKSDVRIISSTNRYLQEDNEEMHIRSDLLFRLNALTLQLPPVRNREEDSVLLANYFLKEKSSSRKTKKLSKRGESAILKYWFPGNIREIEHMIERALVFSDEQKISVDALGIPEPSAIVEANPYNISTLEDIEKKHILKTLKKYKWNREETCESLGIGLKTLYNKIKYYNLSPDDEVV
jgi:DNA-binding NtrC family response regulator